MEWSPRHKQRFDAFRSAWNPSLSDVSYGHSPRGIRQQAQQLIASLSLSEANQEEEEWRLGFERGESDALLALLLLACTKLKHLTIDADFFQANFVDAALTAAAANGRLTELQSVDFGSDLRWGADVRKHNCTYECALPLLRLPSFKSMVVALPSRTFEWTGTTPTTTSLTKLVLHHTQILPEELSPILSATPNLRHLEYRATYDCDKGRRSKGIWITFFDCPEFSDALAHVQASLESLIISLQWFSLQTDVHNTGVGTPVNGTLKNLSNFGKLLDLNVPYSLLLCDKGPTTQSPSLLDILPRSLRSLMLTDETEMFFETGWLGGMKLADAIWDYLRDRDPDCASRSIERLTLAIFCSDAAASVDFPVEARQKFEDVCSRASVQGVLDIPVKWEEWDPYDLGDTLPAGRYRNWHRD